MLLQSGLPNLDPMLVNMVSIAAQKFIADIAADALTHNKMQQSLRGKPSKNGKRDKKFVMNTEDVTRALEDKGILVKRQPYFCNI